MEALRLEGQLSGARQTQDGDDALQRKKEVESAGEACLEKR